MNLLPLWDKFSKLPMGKRTFSRLVGLYAPYTGSIGATVLELRAGLARIELRDRRKVRNHLNSIHAVAQMNLGEMATGLAMFVSLPEDARFIVQGFDTKFLKKARGTIVAVGECEVPKSSERQSLQSRCRIYDEAGNVVTECVSHLLIGPKKGKA